MLSLACYEHVGRVLSEPLLYVAGSPPAENKNLPYSVSEILTAGRTWHDMRLSNQDHPTEKVIKKTKLIHPTGFVLGSYNNLDQKKWEMETQHATIFRNKENPNTITR